MRFIYSHLGAMQLFTRVIFYAQIVPSLGCFAGLAQMWNLERTGRERCGSCDRPWDFWRGAIEKRELWKTY